MTGPRRKMRAIELVGSVDDVQAHRRTIAANPRVPAGATRWAARRALGYSLAATWTVAERRLPGAWAWGALPAARTAARASAACQPRGASVRY